MRENYNSFNYWESFMDRNKTIRGHMFMEKPPTEKSVYFHTLIFSKGNGINNTWGYCPNLRSLIGYIQYSFLQEAFYKWIYGKEQLVTRVPHITVDRIVENGQKDNKINKDTALNMKKEYDALSKLWEMPLNKAEIELRKFVIEFNRKWIGDDKEFLYIKFFKTPEELGDFVVSSSLLSSTEAELENKIGMSLNEWKNVCRYTIKDSIKGEVFRNILLKKLTEVF